MKLLSYLSLLLKTLALLYCSVTRCLTKRVPYTSPPPLPSKLRSHPCPVPRHPFSSPDPVSLPRSSVAASSEATKSSTVFDSTIPPPSSKPKPKPCKSYVLSKALVPGPFRVSSPPYNKCYICDPDSPPKSKVKTKASHDCSLSQSKSFLLLYFSSRANFHLLSSSS